MGCGGGLAGCWLVCAGYTGCMGASAALYCGYAQGLQQRGCERGPVARTRQGPRAAAGLVAALYVDMAQRPQAAAQQQHLCASRQQRIFQWNIGLLGLRVLMSMLRPLCLYIFAAPWLLAALA